MIIGAMSGIPFLPFSLRLAPVAVVCLAINYLVLAVGFRHVLRAAHIHTDTCNAPVPALDRKLFALTCVTLGLVFAGFCLESSTGLSLAWTALAGAALLMTVARRDTHEVLKLVDWHLLLFFAALFVVVHGLNGTGLSDKIFHRLQHVIGASTTAQASNLTWFGLDVPSWNRLQHRFRVSGEFGMLPAMPLAKDLITALRSHGLGVVGLTSRPIDEYPNLYDDTLYWLMQRNLVLDAIWWGSNKPEKLAQHLPHLNNIALVIDDDPRYIHQYVEAKIKRIYWVTNTDSPPSTNSSVIAVTNLRAILDHLSEGTHGHQ